MAPDTMVAAVAQNTVTENQEAFDGQSVVDDFVHRLQVKKMGGAHKTAYAEHQPEADEP